MNWLAVSARGEIATVDSAGDLWVAAVERPGEPVRVNLEAGVKEREGAGAGVPERFNELTVSFAPSQGLLAMAGPGRIYLVVNLWGNRSIRTIDDIQVRWLALSRDGRRLATSSDGPVRLWDLDGAGQTERLSLAQPDTIHALFFSPDGGRLGVISTSAAQRNQARVWTLDGPALVDLACRAAPPGASLPEDVCSDRRFSGVDCNVCLERRTED